MQKAICGAFVALVSLGVLSSCDEAKRMYAEGRVGLGTGGNVMFPSGSLAEGGADYYGTCAYGGDEKLSLTVGTSSMSEISSTDEMFVEVTGIQGPPEEGVYVDPTADPSNLEPKDGGEFKFGVVNVVNGGLKFRFTQAEVGDDCTFDMFATPVDGELSLEGRRAFDYYVRMYCGGLTEVKSGSTSLNSVDIEFYLSNCD